MLCATLFVCHRINNTTNALWKVDEEIMAFARDLFVSNITSWKPEEIFVLIASSNAMASTFRIDTKEYKLADFSVKK